LSRRATVKLTRQAARRGGDTLPGHAQARVRYLETQERRPDALQIERRAEESESLTARALNFPLACSSR